MQVPTTITFPVVRNKPVAKFRYKGSHSKPVRRTVLLTEIKRGTLTGYELRSGNETHDPAEEVIRSYTRDDIFDLERFSIAACDNI